MNDLREIERIYNETIQQVRESHEAGQKRTIRGKLVENLAKNIVTNAWLECDGDLVRLGFKKKTYRLKISDEYLNSLDSDVKEYLSSNKKKYYKRQVDLHVSINDEFIMGVECKSYTENAMLKRVLVDFDLLKIDFPNLKCVLLQLESQLTGDYKLARNAKYGSPSSHSLMAQFPNVDLKILTLLEGERHPKQEISKKEFEKTMFRENVEFARDEIQKILEQYL